MAFLGGSVSVFALRWAVGFLGNISRSRDMGFNARVTATVMLTGIGSWHLSPGPARPGPACLPMWWNMVEGLLPYPPFMVYLSGVREICRSPGLLYSPTQQFCGWDLLLLLAAMFSANTCLAPNQLPPPDGLPTRSWQVWSRPAFQLLHVGWIWFAALHRPTQLRTTIHA